MKKTLAPRSAKAPTMAERRAALRALRAALIEHCEGEWKQIGFLQDRRPFERPKVEVSKDEERAQKAFAKARRALRDLVAIARDAAVSGPCTDYLATSLPRLARLLDDEPWEENHRWRPHSATRLESTTAFVVALYGGLTFNGARLTDRQLACISFLYGATIRGETVEACIRSEQSAVGAARRRADSERKQAEQIALMKRGGARAKVRKARAKSASRV